MATDMKRFWDKIKKSDDCWEWQAAKHRFGYGWFRVNGKTLLAHRFVWTLIHGEIPAGKVICHKCGNPPCCNPDHLFIGTHADNIADRDRKGRTRVGVGERNGKAKLTEEDVKYIRSSPLNGVQLARAFNVVHSLIYGIRRRQYWKHVP